MGMLDPPLERSEIDATVGQQSAQQAREIHQHERGETLNETRAG